MLSVMSRHPQYSCMSQIKDQVGPVCKCIIVDTYIVHTLEVASTEYSIHVVDGIVIVKIHFQVNL